ncbi:hypothetical protein PR048_030254 [Dryococelus australis]|uniref:Uncharacterized protein n=1 Tax=Dryococelus australis TaxID=614101 RepID=A0ABQ9G8G9_9NEOP|nr:hypothetical protein PR048_030254 [Dryococelus australis]
MESSYDVTCSRKYCRHVFSQRGMSTVHTRCVRAAMFHRQEPSDKPLCAHRGLAPSVPHSFGDRNIAQFPMRIAPIAHASHRRCLLVFYWLQRCVKLTTSVLAVVSKEPGVMKLADVNKRKRMSLVRATLQRTLALIGCPAAQDPFRTELSWVTEGFSRFTWNGLAAMKTPPYPGRGRYAGVSVVVGYIRGGGRGLGDAANAQMCHADIIHAYPEDRRATTETLHFLRVEAMRRQACVLLSPVSLPRFLTLDATTSHVDLSHVCNTLYVVFLLDPRKSRARCDDQRRLTQTRYLPASSSTYSRGCPIAWPARSPDLTPLEYFLWGHMKGLIYQTSVESEEELLAWVMAVADLGRPGIGDRVYQNMVRRYRVCVRRRWSSHRALLVRGSRRKTRKVRAAQEHCKPVQSPARSGDGSILRRARVTLIAPVLLGFFVPDRRGPYDHSVKIPATLNLLEDRHRQRLVCCLTFTSEIRANRVGRCRWSAGFLRDLPFPLPKHSGAVPSTPRFGLVGSQDLVVKSRPNISTQLTIMNFSGILRPTLRHTASAVLAWCWRTIYYDRELKTSHRTAAPPLRQTWCDVSRQRLGATTNGERAGVVWYDGNAPSEFV